jgi:hypothetical protein
VKKKLYNPPILKELTEEQAKKLVADRKHSNEEEAAEFLKSLRKRKQSDSTDQQQKRSA